MTDAILRDEPAPTHKSSNKSDGLRDRVEQTLSRLRAFCFAPPEVQLDMTYPPLSDELVQRFVRSLDSLEHAKNNPQGKFASEFVSLARYLDPETKKGLCQKKGLDGSEIYNIQKDYDAIPKTQEGAVLRLEAIFKANAQNSTAGRCLELYFNAEARYHWKHLEPSGFDGLKQALTGRAPA